MPFSSVQDTMLQQIQEAEAREEIAKKQIEALKEALDFYANPKTYSDFIPEYPGKKFSMPITYDVDERGQGGALWAAGSRARRALEKLKQDEKDRKHLSLKAFLTLKRTEAEPDLCAFCGGRGTVSTENIIGDPQWENCPQCRKEKKDEGSDVREGQKSGEASELRGVRDGLNRNDQKRDEEGSEVPGGRSSEVPPADGSRDRSGDGGDRSDVETGSSGGVSCRHCLWLPKQVHDPACRCSCHLLESESPSQVEPIALLSEPDFSKRATDFMVDLQTRGRQVKASDIGPLAAELKKAYNEGTREVRGREEAGRGDTPSMTPLGAEGRSSGGSHPGGEHGDQGRDTEGASVDRSDRLSPSVVDKQERGTAAVVSDDTNAAGGTSLADRRPTSAPFGEHPSDAKADQRPSDVTLTSCVECNGSGNVDVARGDGWNDLGICPRCNGLGRVPSSAQRPNEATGVSCPTCHAEPGAPCRDAAGAGRICLKRKAAAQQTRDFVGQRVDKATSNKASAASLKNARKVRNQRHELKLLHRALSREIERRTEYQSALRAIASGPDSNAGKELADTALYARRIADAAKAYVYNPDNIRMTILRNTVRSLVKGLNEHDALKATADAQRTDYPLSKSTYEDGLRDAAQLIFDMSEIHQRSDGLRALDDVRGAILMRAGRDPKEQGRAESLWELDKRREKVDEKTSGDAGEPSAESQDRERSTHNTADTTGAPAPRPVDAGTLFNCSCACGACGNGNHCESKSEWRKGKYGECTRYLPPIGSYPCCEAVRRVDATPGDATTLLGGWCPIHGATKNVTNPLPANVAEANEKAEAMFRANPPKPRPWRVHACPECGTTDPAVQRTSASFGRCYSQYDCDRRIAARVMAKQDAEEAAAERAAADLVKENTELRQLLMSRVEAVRLDEANKEINRLKLLLASTSPALAEVGKMIDQRVDRLAEEKRHPDYESDFCIAASNELIALAEEIEAFWPGDLHAKPEEDIDKILTEIETWTDLGCPICLTSDEHDVVYGDDDKMMLCPLGQLRKRFAQLQGKSLIPGDKVQYKGKDHTVIHVRPDAPLEVRTAHARGLLQGFGCTVLTGECACGATH